MPESHSRLRHHLHRNNAPVFSDKPRAEDGKKSDIGPSIDKGLARFQILMENIANPTLCVRNDLKQVIGMSTALKAASIVALPALPTHRRELKRRPESNKTSVVRIEEGFSQQLTPASASLLSASFS